MGGFKKFFPECKHVNQALFNYNHKLLETFIQITREKEEHQEMHGQLFELAANWPANKQCGKEAQRRAAV